LTESLKGWQMMPKSTPKDKDKQLLTCIDIMGGAPLPKKHFYVLSGSDLFVFSKIQSIFQEKFLADDPSGFNLVKFDCDSNTKASSIMNICEEYPFGSRYKLVIVDNCQKISTDEGEKIKKYLDNPCPTTILVFIQHEAEYGSSTGKFNPSRSLKKALSERGIHIACQLNHGSVKQWIYSRMEIEGKKIAGSVVDQLISIVGIDMWELHQEITKLCIYSGKRSTITADDVHNLTSARPQSKIFNLNENIGAKNIRKALLVLDELVKEKVVGPQVLAALQNHFSFLYKIRAMVDEGENAESIAKKMHKHPYYIKKSVEQAMNFNLDSFDTAFDLLARADGGIKTGFDERWVLELTLIQLCKLKN
jgi:DNA polymerase III subunit delta